MKKQLVIIGIVALLVSVGLSGCSEQNNNNTNAVTSGDTNLVQLVNYDITTTWAVSVNWQSQYYVEQGFYHNYPSNASLPCYHINGTVKNIAGRMLTSIDVEALLYDVNNVYLGSESPLYSSRIVNLPDTYTKSFSIYFYKYASEYFDNIDHCSFKITAQ